MRKYSSMGSLFSFLLSFIGWSVLSTAATANDSIERKEFIVKIVQTKSFNKSLELLKLTQAKSSDAGFQVKEGYEKGSLIAISSSTQHLNKTTNPVKELKLEIEKTLGQGSVQYIVPNRKMKAFLNLNDPKASSQWALEKVGVEQAWEVTKGSSDVVVAVIDTGVDITHQDLKENIWANPNEIPNNGIDDDNNGFVDDVNGWDFHENDNVPDDATSFLNPGHGTHCAGVIGASADNNLGIAGIAPLITLMPIRFLGANGSGDLLNGVKSIDYAIENGADIISASWGAPSSAEEAAPILEAITRAEEAGVIFVAAAANEGNNNDTREIYPANAPNPNVISVAASNSNDGRPRWSNYGKRKVAISAPGDAIISTLPNDSYGNLSGTSMATPLVSGVLALILSKARDKNTTINGLQALAILQSTGDAVNIETQCDCRIHAGKALEAFNNESLIPVPSAKTLLVGETIKLDGVGGAKPYTFAVLGEEVVSLSAENELTADEIGTIEVQITDANGDSAKSLPIQVVSLEEDPKECPLGNEFLCRVSCFINPNQAFCPVGK